MGWRLRLSDSNPWHAMASHGLPAIAELLVFFCPIGCGSSEKVGWYSRVPREGAWEGRGLSPPHLWRSGMLPLNFFENRSANLCNLLHLLQICIINRIIQRYTTVNTLPAANKAYPPIQLYHLSQISANYLDLTGDQCNRECTAVFLRNWEITLMTPGHQKWHGKSTLSRHF